MNTDDDYLDLIREINKVTQQNVKAILKIFEEDKFAQFKNTSYMTEMITRKFELMLQNKLK